VHSPLTTITSSKPPHNLPSSPFIAISTGALETEPLRLGFPLFASYVTGFLLNHVDLDLMSACCTPFSIMYPGFCKVVLDNKIVLFLFYGLEDLSVDASHD